METIQQLKFRNAPTEEQIEKINTEVGNLMPACKSCGSLRIKCSFEGKMDTERFRKEIIEMYEFARDHAMYATSIQRALKYGMIVETNKPLRFYFETIGITSN